MADVPRDQPAASGAPISRSRRLLRRVTALCMSLILSLLVCEIFVRILAPQVLSVPQVDYEDGVFCQPRNLRGRQQVPGLFNVAYETNSQRFRARSEFAPVPPPGVTRIAMIGDSMTFGLGADFDDAYPSVLERILNQSAKHEVINAGCGRTGTGMQALWYDRSVSQLKPDIVVLTVFVNDVDDDLEMPVFNRNPDGAWVPKPRDAAVAQARSAANSRKITRYVPGYAYLCQHSHLVNLCRRVGSTTLAKKPQNQEKEKYRQRFISEGTVAMTGELVWLNNRVRQDGARLVIAYFPTRESLYDDVGAEADDARWQADRVLQTLRDFSNAHQVPFIDPTPVFKAAAASQDLYYKGLDRHPRPAGYKLFAEQVAGFLRSSGPLAIR